MKQRLSLGVRRLQNLLWLPAAAHAERRRDRAGVPEHDPGTSRVLSELIDWRHEFPLFEEHAAPPGQ